MKVTVDTRHDSLEEALATVHAAFGSSTTQAAPAVVATELATPPAAMRHVAKRARSPKGAAARPATKAETTMKSQQLTGTCRQSGPHQAGRSGGVD